jgi:hypothetical protein
MADSVVGYIYSDNTIVEFTSHYDGPVALVFSSETGDFESRFTSWQLDHHKKGEEITIVMSCSGVPYRIALETRFVVERGGKLVEVGAKVISHDFGNSNLSLMSIGVRPGSYQLKKN